MDTSTANAEQTHGPKKRVMETVIAALARGETYRRAAEEGGVTERVIYNWRRNDPQFRQKLKEAKEAVVHVAVARISSRMSDATDTLADLLHSPDDDVRHKAAVSILEIANKLRASLEVEERVQELEAAVKEKGSAKSK